jgi:hypothetical protein
MPITVNCPQCRKPLRVPDGMAGQQGRCPSCGSTFTIPQENYATQPTAPPTGITASPPPAGNPFAFDEQQSQQGYDFSQLDPTRPALATSPSTLHALYLVFAFLAGLEFLGLAGLVSLGFLSDMDRQFARQGEEIAMMAVCSFYLAFIAQLVMFCVLLYRCWGIIQDGYPRTTPGAAVGYLFVPIYNIYWQFVAVRGLAEDLNRYAQKRGLHIREASVALATTYLVLNLCAIIPVVGLLILVPNQLIYLLAIYSIKTAAVDIATAKGY